MKKFTQENNIFRIALRMAQMVGGFPAPYPRYQRNPRSKLAVHMILDSSVQPIGG
ncbi:MAG: hypothetical protein HY736_19105 [Verrucomicrobia bacterium]|nr:hypothetical protein [Verrucomicrobiota bacterium]